MAPLLPDTSYSSYNGSDMYRLDTCSVRIRTSRLTVTSFECTSLQLLHFTCGLRATSVSASTPTVAITAYLEVIIERIRGGLEIGDVLKVRFDRQQKFLRIQAST